MSDGERFATAGHTAAASSLSNGQSRLVMNAESAFWMLLFLFVTYYTDIVNVCLFDERIRSRWLYGSVIGWGIFAMMFCYLVIYVSHIRGIKSTTAWQRRTPWAIPVATAGAVGGSICTVFVFWPVFGIFTIPILFSQLMGWLIIASLMPM